MSYSRYAVYFLPQAGSLADFGAAWLGWDVAGGRAVPQPDIQDLDAVTANPRKYGFHATLKPPFRLAEGTDAAGLAAAVAELAQKTAPAQCDGLGLAALGRFLALTLRGDASGVQRVAATCVDVLDRFRAAATEAELARRRKARLTPRQEALLVRWGYPYVMDAFRFHMTLTGPLPKDGMDHWHKTAAQQLPALPAPFVLDSIALCGEREDGFFEMVGRYPLAGA